MHRILLFVLTSLLVVGCGGEDSSGAGGAGGTPRGIETLGLDPFGRGDGIDITQSGYSGRCYEDDALEANLPDQDPRVVAANAAAEKSEESGALLAEAGSVLRQAQRLYEQSVATKMDATPEQIEAGADLEAVLFLAKLATAEAYTQGLAFFGPDVPDAAGNFETFINFISPQAYKVALVVAEELYGGMPDLAKALVYDVARSAFLQGLKIARDAAESAYDAYDTVASSIPDGSTAVVVAEPTEQEGYQNAQAAYDALSAQAFADAEAAIAALNFIDSPSDLPPCDSSELKEWIKAGICTDAAQQAFADGDFDVVDPDADELEQEIEAAVNEKFKAFFVQATDLVCGGEGGG